MFVTAPIAPGENATRFSVRHQQITRARLSRDMNVLIAPAALIYADPSLTLHFCPKTEVEIPLNF